MSSADANYRFEHLLNVTSGPNQERNHLLGTYRTDCRYFVALTLARNTPRLFILNKALAFVIKDTLLLLRLLHYTFTTTETPLKLVKIILRFSSNALFH